jgi:glycosyltransferase involved in cell wall biosynthesis
MNIVWFSWKDINHPAAGGAEHVSWQLMKQLVRDGHDVRLITARYEGSKARETMDGVEIFRDGGRYGVYPKARKLFKSRMADWPNLVIDEMNTLPFGVAFYSRKPRVLLTYQLARNVWFYQARFPVSIIGYLVEPLYLFAMSRMYRRVLTESESTRQDLRRFGFHERGTHVFRVSIGLNPVKAIDSGKPLDTVLILGAMRPMKRTLDAVKAFELARDRQPGLKLSVAGDSSGSYGEKVLKYIEKSRHAEGIKILGRVSSDERVRLMRESAVILVTSIKEGWGLIVTEANSQGTPAIVYDTDGLRDSVKDGETGMLVRSGDIFTLGNSIHELLADRKTHTRLSTKALEDSRQYTFKNSYADFLEGSGINRSTTAG